MLTLLNQRRRITAYLLLGCTIFNLAHQSFQPLQASQEQFLPQEYSYDQAHYEELKGSHRFFFRASNLARFDSLDSKVNRAKGLAQRGSEILSKLGKFANKMIASAKTLIPRPFEPMIDKVAQGIQEIENTRIQLKPKIIIASPKDLQAGLSKFIPEDQDSTNHSEDKIHRLQDFIQKQREKKPVGILDLLLAFDLKNPDFLASIRNCFASIHQHFLDTHSSNQALSKDLRMMSGFQTQDDLRSFLGTTPAQALEQRYWSMSEQRINRLTKLWLDAQKLRESPPQKPTLKTQIARFFGSKKSDEVIANEYADRMEAKVLKQVNAHADGLSASKHLSKGFKKLKNQIAQTNINQICQSQWNEPGVVGDLSQSKLFDLSSPVEKESKLTTVVRWMFKRKKAPLFEGKDEGLAERFYTTSADLEVWNKLGGIAAQTVACVNPKGKVKYFTLPYQLSRESQIKQLSKNLRANPFFNQSPSIERTDESLGDQKMTSSPLSSTSPMRSSNSFTSYSQGPSSTKTRSAMMNP